MKYIIMNKEENRIQIETQLPASILFSGELSNVRVTAFSPVIYSNWLKAKWVAINYSGVVIPLTENKDTIGNYKWLRLTTTGKVYRVWHEYKTNISMSCYKLKDSNIMIKGVGVFTEEDFTEFNFQVGSDL